MIYLQGRNSQMLRHIGFGADWQETLAVSADHFFQRIVFDHACGGVWYEYRDRPAYMIRTKDQVQRAVKLWADFANGHIDLQKLNQQSLIRRVKHR